MKPDQITYTKRHNEGNYSHSEYSIVATLDEGDDVQECFLKLKSYVLNVIEGATPEAPVAEITPVAEVKEEIAELPPVIPAEALVEEPKKPRAKAPKKEKPEIKSIPYDRNLDAHRQFLSAYLTQNHADWKTKEGVKEFSLSLIGQPFLDEDGHIIESFKKVLSDFFA